MPEPKAQLIDPQGPIDVPGLSVTGVTTATGGFVGQVQGAATGLASTTANLSVGIVTATKFVGNTPGNVSGLADDTNINVGIITSTSFTGDLVGNAAGLSTTTANINAGIMSATSFAGNFTGVASGITGTPNIVVGIMTGTLNGDGSSLTGIAATNWIANNVTANSSTTTVNLSLGNIVKFTQSANTTVSFANTGTSNIVSFIRVDDNSGTDRTITWPSSIKWNGGSAPTLVNNARTTDANVITLLTRDEGVTWYGWETVNADPQTFELFSIGGSSNNGQMGQNDRTQRSSPVQLGSEDTWVNIGSTGQSDGQANGIAVKSDGTLWTWGNNPSGQLGQNNRTQYSSPVQVPGTTWAFGDIGSAAVKTDGTLWMWGANTYGSLGQNDRTRRSSPTQVPGTTWSTDQKSLSVGGGFTAAIKNDGTLWVWGYGNTGRLGLNSSPGNKNYSSPVQVGSATTWDTIDTGGGTCFATKTDGTLWSWGSASGDGDLGHNDKTNRSAPIQIPGTTWANGYQKVTAHAQGGAAIRTDGTLWTWGNNGDGELGLNNKTEYSSPKQVPGTTWRTVQGGQDSMMATKTDGTLWVWGSNTQGSLGQNNRTNESSPKQVPGTWGSQIVVMAGANRTFMGTKLP